MTVRFASNCPAVSTYMLPNQSDVFAWGRWLVYDQFLCNLGVQVADRVYELYRGLLMCGQVQLVAPKGARVSHFGQQPKNATLPGRACLYAAPPQKAFHRIVSSSSGIKLLANWPRYNSLRTVRPLHVARSLIPGSGDAKKKSARRSQPPLCSCLR